MFDGTVTLISIVRVIYSQLSLILSSSALIKVEFVTVFLWRLSLSVSRLLLGDLRMIPALLRLANIYKRR